LLRRDATKVEINKEGKRKIIKTPGEAIKA